MTKREAKLKLIPVLEEVEQSNALVRRLHDEGKLEEALAELRRTEPLISKMTLLAEIVAGIEVQN